MKATNKVYTLADLPKWDYQGVTLCLLGHPVAHSLSPVMYNAAFAEMAKKDSQYENWRFFKFDIPSPYLAEALEWCHLKKFMGISLTIPHKVDAVRIIRSIDEVAKKMEAVNALVFEDVGYRGFNTDGYGLEAAIKYELGISIKGKKVILLGAGGAAKAAAVQCLLSGCNELWIGNRTLERLNDLMKALGIMGRGKVHGFKLDKLPKEVPKSGLLINATSVGMGEEEEVPVDLDYFDSSLKVYDVVYKMRDTRLVCAALERGMKACNGLRMLVEQGARSLQVWTRSSKAPIETMWKAVTKVEKVTED